MKISASQIAQILGGEIIGDASIEVSGLSKIDDGKEHTLSFLANPAYTEHIYTTQASVVIVGSSFAPERNLPEGCTLIKVADPYAGFAKLLELYNKIKHDKEGVDRSASVHPEAKISDKVYVGPLTAIEAGAEIAAGAKIYGQCYIGENVRIGAGTILHPGVRILANCEIGDDCVINAGAVIGGDGFGFAPNSENNYNKVAQIGNVILENHVEIGANTTIDRATLGSTIIRRGAKIDNLIQIAHNVEIGENTVIASQTGIAGSTKIGRNCMIGGQVGIIGHLTIADGTKIAAQSGIGSSITRTDSVLQGSPAFQIGDYKRSYVGYRRLPELMKEVQAMKEELAALKRSTEI
ncbi:MAG: UDP-3-O-(3-hydroxymyristoyl)glucosamine N-acyltransferase [Cryomorphaceae bacterium]|nr:UDP-3-O-(3-hydroxymyristoyl)glucosamine N-acyltransferase [Flavobacteriales bacterium]